MNKLEHYFIVSAFLLVASAEISFSQTTENYVRTYSALVSLQGDLSQVNNKSLVHQSTTYFDGLGRPIQAVVKEGSPLGYDLVSLWVYDRYGRKTKSYLPYTSAQADGVFKDDAQASQASFYQTQFGVDDGLNGVSVQVAEISELARVLKQGAPGTPWQPNSNPLDPSDHSIKNEYTTNLTDEVLLWKYDVTTETASAKADGVFQYYNMNELSVSRTYDEQNHLVIEYTDKMGKVVLKRVQATSSQIPIDHVNYASTYYIYDDFGNLVIVLPPEAVKQLSGN